jgi:hypothetical protein
LELNFLISRKNNLKLGAKYAHHYRANSIKSQQIPYYIIVKYRENVDFLGISDLLSRVIMNMKKIVESNSGGSALIHNVLLKGTNHRGDGLIRPRTRLKARTGYKQSTGLERSVLSTGSHTFRCRVYCCSASQL